jgi:antitoxin component of MazEF toxin-antitoxin module
MIKRLTRVGNSQALTIDKPILELLGMTADTPVEIQTNGHSLMLTPIRPQTDERRAAVRKAMEEANALLGPVLRELAK